MIPILILAAGQSTRMRGRDKLLEDVGGVPLLRHQVVKALATGHPVYVAVSALAGPRCAAIRDLPTICLAIPDAAAGMSVTLRDAVVQLPLCEAFMLVLGDLVSLETDDLQAVLTARGLHPNHLIWRGATTDGKPGHPVIFDGSLRPSFANLGGDNGGDSIVAPLKNQTHLVKLTGQRARFDLDTPEDWAEWRKANG